jgi:Glycosyltransferase Family 4
VKILMIAPEPCFTPRGTPLSVRARTQAILALGHTIDLVTYHIGDDISLPGLRIYRTPQIAWIRSVAIGPSLTKLCLDFLLFALALFRAFRERYDVVHTHEEAALMGTVLAPLIGAQHVYDMHSSLPQQFKNCQSFNYRPIVRLFEGLERIVIRRAHAVITICPDLSEHVTTIDKGRPCFLIENTLCSSQQFPQVIPPVQTT